MTDSFYKPLELERRILDFWRKKKLLEKYLNMRRGRKRFSFMDGPPTANNPMGVHHAWGRTYKDLYLRFKTMQGFDARKQPGFDCQGLWVEVGVEKELGFKTKKDIERFGIGKFTEKCEEAVFKWVKIWIELSERLGMWMDWKNPYLTLTDKNIEYVWYFLKVCFEKGWLYKGFKVLPWCPRCGTSLSQHEVASGYKELVHKAVYLKFPIKNKQNEFLLVYTTTPWTLPADVAAAVHPDLTYVKVQQENEKYILCENLLSVLVGNFEVVEKFKGKDLEGLEFAAPLQELPLQKNVKHRVVLSKVVSSEEGTGIVHIAPGHGPEDYEIGLKYKLPVLSPIDEAAVFDSSAGWLEGKNTKEANELIIEFLRKKNLIYKITDIKHSYPTCWRCGEELVFRTGEEWFIKTGEIKAKLIKAVKKVKFYPGWAQKSMLDWLENLRDWNISRKRYYGLPLPFWQCEEGHIEVIGSKTELKKRAVRGFDQLKELHRPWIDNVLIKCRSCKKEMKRITEIGDVWLDAAVVFFSTLDYLDDRKYWSKWFPADFTTEMHEQLKLWFYATLFVSMTLENKAPYKSVLAHAMVLDETGREMHKSWGNVIWADEALDKMGADTMRWMYSSQNPGIDLKFGYTPAKEIQRTLNVFYNTGKYVQTYCETNGYKPGRIPRLDLASRWIFSRLESVKQNVTKYLDDLKPQLATKEIEEFFLNDFSRYYIHIIRSKVKPGYPGKDKDAALFTIYDVMFNLLRLLAPFLPFFTEDLYQNYFKKFVKKASIHFTDWPEVNKKLINKELEEDMQIVKKVIEAASAARNSAGLKLRWPIRQVLIQSKDKKVKNAVDNLNEILLSMTNSKEVRVVKSVGGEFSEADFDFGKVFVDKKLDEKLLEEAMIRELIRSIQDLRKKKGFKVHQFISLTLNSDHSTNNILKKYLRDLKKEVGAKKIEIGSIKGKNRGHLEFENKKIDIAFD